MFLRGERLRGREDNKDMKRGENKTKRLQQLLLMHL